MAKFHFKLISKEVTHTHTYRTHDYEFLKEIFFLIFDEEGLSN